MVAPWRGRRAPSCLYECYDADAQCLDPTKYYLYRRARARDLEEDDWFKIIAACEHIAKEEQREHPKPPKRTGGTKRKFDPPAERIYRDPVDGSIKQFGPHDTEWYRNYVESPDLDCLKFRKKFRRRFRCSYLSFQKHLADVKESDLFKAWSEGACNCAGKRSIGATRGGAGCFL
ncbi:hypothetical protein ACHAXT_002134 [Thalassiosira profunda]